MGEVEEVQLQVMDKSSFFGGDKEATLPMQCDGANQLTVNRSRNHLRWIRIGILASFVLCCQAAAILLGRQYYDKGGNSECLSTLAQFGGFPILLLSYCINPPRRKWYGLLLSLTQLAFTRVVKREALTAILDMLYAIGSTGLIFETSSLFSNAVGIAGLPIVPVLAVVFFHDKMHGLKVIAMVLAIWGFLSYVCLPALSGRPQLQE
ncbi:hypothetical protein WN944_012480 [Citrus x changshan-huyou]|uniref:Uncharacterized protein n=1 Tax=Citrus x changshan-huyou TaxID=2935761 RepID=A0AAP0MXU7_9ROSI